MNRSTQNSFPLAQWRTRQDRGTYQEATPNIRDNLHSAFTPYLPAAGPPNSIREVHDPWRFSQERATNRPVSIASFPAPRYFPDQTMFLVNDATRNTHPRQRQLSPDASSFQDGWNMHASRAEDSRLTQDEQKQALNKLKKEIYNPVPKRMTKKPNLYYREYDINSFKEIAKGNDEDGKRCAICLEDFEPKEVVTVTPCKHMFHEDCIIPWVKSQGRCPVCRFEICERLRQNAAPSGNANADDQFEIGLISVIRALQDAFLSENMRFHH